MIFHSESNYDYHFVIKELRNLFEGELNFLGGNTKKYKTFSFSIEKEVRRIGKSGAEIMKAISYKVIFIDSARFMASC